MSLNTFTFSSGDMYAKADVGASININVSGGMNAPP